MKPPVTGIGVEPLPGGALEVETVEKILGVARSAGPKLRAIVTAAVRGARRVRS